MIFFSIITPTHKRSDKLSRCLNSVLNQSYKNFEMIIVNDSPDDSSYLDLEKNISDSRIKYFKNEKNMGVNYSRNFALNNLSPDSNFVIFLDDDDWFTDNTLLNLENLIKENPNENWFVTNRTYENGKSLTFAPKNNTHYDYALNYLIGKKIKGDATHCIKTNTIKNIRFSKKVKNGEEWFFFYQLGLKNKIFYSNQNSTLSEGYDENGGLNFRKRNFSERFNSLANLTNEGVKLRLIYHTTFILYMTSRTINTILKQLFR